MSNTRAGKRPRLGDTAHPLTGGGLAATRAADNNNADDAADNAINADERKTSASPPDAPGAGEGGDAAVIKAKTDVEAVLAAGGTRIPGTGAGHGCLHDVVYPPDWQGGCRRPASQVRFVFPSLDS